jgi:hypothetical protein
MTRSRIKREGFAELLDAALRSGVIGCVEVENATAVVVDDEEALENLQRGR